MPAPAAVAPAEEADIEAAQPRKTSKEKAAEAAGVLGDKAKEKGAAALEGVDGGEGLAGALGDSDSFMFRALAIIVPLQYFSWYVAVVAFSVAFGETFSMNPRAMLTGIEPFDHINFSPLVTPGDWKPLINWLSEVVTLTVVTPWLVYFVCRPAKRATDCGTAMQALHFFAATTITQQTPENWVWWATTMPCFVFMGRVTELMIEKMPPPRRNRRKGKMSTPYSKTG